MDKIGTFCLINGDFVLEREVAISCTDSSYLFGFGLFETLLWDGKLKELEQHRERIQQSLKYFFSVEDFEFVTNEQVADLVQKNGITGSARVRVTISEKDGKLSTLVSATPYQQREGLVILIVSPFRVNEKSAEAGHKTTSYANYRCALRQAQHDGAGEALMLNAVGVLAECSTANIFFVKDGVVHTPALSSGCLPGIMRAKVIKQCRDLDIQVEEAEYSLEDILSAEAVFITNSLRRIQLVSQIDEVVFSSDQSPVISKLILSCP